MRNTKMPFIGKGHFRITKAQQAFLSIHGGIPCNLAPAHFTVHVVQVRLNFALGFVVEANPACDLSLLAASLCICTAYTFQRLARFRVGGGKSDLPSAFSALLSYRYVHVGVWRSFRLPGGFSSLHKIPSWKFWTLHGLG